jgi:hypothetical protein
MRAASALAAALVTWNGLAAQEARDEVPAEVIQGEAIEQFLMNARITRMRDLSGVTAPRRVTLELDGVTHDAVFKTVDRDEPGITRDGDNNIDVNFEDSWRTEVAAYQVDRIIGLGMVPATVERSHQGERGSLQFWVRSEMNEHQRATAGIIPPDQQAFAKQGLNLWLFDNLIHNVDRHPGNILITKEFRIILIDHSRSFRVSDRLPAPDYLQGFSRSVLAGLARLDRDVLRARIGKYVTNAQINAVLTRRDAILALARQRAAELGDEAVLLP